MRRKLACCTREKQISLDFDEQDRIMTYDGLESCILNTSCFENESGTSRGDGCITDSLDEDESSCSSSKDAFGSFSSQWDMSESPQHFYVKEKPFFTFHSSDVETMKETFANLLLGEDVTGGKNGLTTALALSNAITNLAISVFGELWKLEPLPEEGKSKWRREMDWLLFPTNYMVELVPARQHGTNGRSLEIMIPKARADVHMNLPALQKLDTMLIEMLDSMVDSEFWYEEGSSRAEGRIGNVARQSKRWWLPSPQVPKTGLSDSERKKMLHKGNVVHQIFKAAKSINANVLLEMPIPTIIREALPRSGKASLGEELCKVLTTESASSAEEMLNSLNMKSEHSALDTVNRLEAAIFLWKERIAEQSTSMSPVRKSWSFMKDPISEMEKMELQLERAEVLLQLIKIRYPNLPHTFLDVTKVQHARDVGHSIMEAYSRVLANLAFSILSRITDILQEDAMSNSSSPVAAICYFAGLNIARKSETPVVTRRVRHSLIDQMNDVDGAFCDFYTNDISDLESEAKTSSVTATPSRRRVWCIGREACISTSARNSP